MTRCNTKTQDTRQWFFMFVFTICMVELEGMYMGRYISPYFLPQYCVKTSPYISFLRKTYSRYGYLCVPQFVYLIQNEDHQAFKALLATSGSGCKSLRIRHWDERHQQYDVSLKFTPGWDKFVVHLISCATQPSAPGTDPASQIQNQSSSNASWPHNVSEELVPF